MPNPALEILRAGVCRSYTILKLQLAQAPASDAGYPSLFDNSTEIYATCPGLLSSVLSFGPSLGLVDAACGSKPLASSSPTLPPGTTAQPTTLAPTAAPTTAPTTANTSAPVTVNTSAPVTVNTSAPTVFPTVSPATTAAPTIANRDWVWDTATTNAPAAQCAKAFAAVDAFLGQYRALRDAFSKDANKPHVLQSAPETWTLTFTTPVLIVTDQTAELRSTLGNILRNGSQYVSAAALITVTDVKYADASCAQTAAPTLSPTAPGTTFAPTTLKPTTASTAAPTTAPTNSSTPTLAPTSAPTNSSTPTLAPSAPTPPANTTAPALPPTKCNVVTVTSMVWSDDWTLRPVTVDAAASQLYKGQKVAGLELAQSATHTGTAPNPGGTPAPAAEEGSKTTMIIIIVVVVVVVIVVIAAVVVSKKRSGHSTSRDGTSGIDL